MAGFVASGATLTFLGVRAIATRVSVEHPQAEVVDMTPINAPANQLVLVPTGSRSGGIVNVDFIQPNGGIGPLQAIGRVGVLSFSGNVFSLSNRAVCETATQEAATGDLIRGTMRFRLTDYTATDSNLGGGNTFF
jgi:hypothetical protein